MFNFNQSGERIKARMSLVADVVPMKGFLLLLWRIVVSMLFARADGALQVSLTGQQDSTTACYHCYPGCLG